MQIYVLLFIFCAAYRCLCWLPFHQLMSVSWSDMDRTWTHYQCGQIVFAVTIYRSKPVSIFIDVYTIWIARLTINAVKARCLYVTATAAECGSTKGTLNRWTFRRGPVVLVTQWSSCGQLTVHNTDWCLETHQLNWTLYNFLRPSI